MMYSEGKGRRALGSEGMFREAFIVGLLDI